MILRNLGPCRCIRYSATYTVLLLEHSNSLEYNTVWQQRCSCKNFDFRFLISHTRKRYLWGLLLLEISRSRPAVPVTASTLFGRRLLSRTWNMVHGAADGRRRGPILNRKHHFFSAQSSSLACLHNILISPHCLTYHRIEGRHLTSNNFFFLLHLHQPQ